MIQRRRTASALDLLNSLIESEESKIDDKILCNLLLSFMYERDENIKECEKYLALAEKYYKIKQNPHLKLNPPENPYEEPKPKVPKPERYTSQLTHGQSQEIRLNFITLLSNLNLYDLIAQYMNKMEDSQRK